MSNFVLAPPELTDHGQVDVSIEMPGDNRLRTAIPP
jgi:hypothetical protein